MVKVYPQVFVLEDMVGLTKKYSLECFCNAKIAGIFVQQTFSATRCIIPTEWCNGGDNESSQE